MTKLDMLDEMETRHWNHDLTEKTSYDDIKEEYDTMKDEYAAAEIDMSPNGRDYTAENEEGM